MRLSKMQPARFLLILMAFIACMGLTSMTYAEQAPGRTLAQQATKDAELWNTTD
ncbi:MAG: hypothetical protein JRI93_16415, partial [Deltaproteobacteria bacterium]|nr:hypothetical protein [Deltaproteobacteria bacterium]